MKYMPTLLPGHFLNMLKKGKEEELKDLQTKNDEGDMEDSAYKPGRISLLSRLEELIKSAEVWKFGFGNVSKTGYWKN